MKEFRDFEKTKNGKIKVTVKSENVEVYLPIDGENKTVGTSDSVATQIIEDVETFVTFLKDQLLQSQKQISEIEKHLKDLEYIKDDIIPESILQDLAKYLTAKKSKATMEALKSLNKYLEGIYTKRDLNRKLEQMKKINADLKEQNAKLELIL